MKAILYDKLKTNNIIFISILYILISLSVVFFPKGTIILTFGIILSYFFVFRTRAFFIMLFFLLFIQQSLISTNTIYAGGKASGGTIISRADDLIWFILIVLVLIKMIKRKTVLSIDSFDFSVFLLVLFSLLSLIANGRSFIWGNASIILMIKGYIIYFIADKLNFHRNHIKYFIITYYISLVIIAIFGYLQIVGLNPPMFPPQTRFGIKMINSIFNQHTQFGSIMAIGTALSLSFVLIKKNKWLYFLIILFTIAVILSTSRRSLLAVLVVFLALPFLYKDVSNKIYIPIFITLAIFIFIFRNQLLLLMKFTSADYMNNFISTPRGELYLGAIQILKHKFLLGEGPGSYAGLVSRVTNSTIYMNYGISFNTVKYSSDTYIAHILGEIGVIGFILYTNMIVNIYKKIVKLQRYFKKQKDELLISIILFLKFVLIIGIIESFVSSFFEVAIKTIALYGILGMVSSYYKIKKDELKAL